MLPSTPRLRLWREALKHFDIPVTSLPRALSRREKYLIEGQWVGTEEQQLAAVVLLSRGACREVTIARLRGWTSFTGLQSVVHMLGAARSLGLNSAIFTALVKLIDAGVSVWDLSIPDDLVCIDKAGEKVLSVRAGIRVLGLKGVVLSSQLFGNAALRNPRDIDLLVSPDEFVSAESVLLEAGYQRSGATLSPRQGAAYRRWVKDVGYVNSVTGI